jgi:hypothetical protein
MGRNTVSVDAFARLGAGEKRAALGENIGQYLVDAPRRLDWAAAG